MLVGAIFLYFIIFSWLSFKKYQGFDYNSFDLAIFNQVFFNTAHGRLFDLTINLHNYLGDHFEPMILLLLPFYLSKSSPVTLLFLQSAIIALSAWPLYLIAKKVLSKSSLALLIAILWLLNPFVHSANLYEFHLLAFAPFFFFWTFYFYQQNKFKLFCLFFILSLLVREDISLLLVSFAFLSYLDKKDSREGLGFYVVTRAPFKLSPDDAAKYPGNKKIGIFKVIEAEILPVSEYNPVQGHFLIGAFNEFNKAPGWECRHPTSIIGIAEDEKELEDKLYECALKYAKRIAVIGAKTKSKR